ncbi:sterol O-acyltransferase 2 [Magnaporthiopsis poae ATCC 64411]|uniref:O-acyltransferase n=1 Tax=Magnaporthiopsis poae (strain ATCC 64411 / 73-15) TaxID=644358 RepID=A0A0C4EBC5_MAGP6|nr:sterol O-acyltransferase 2 [Magnaporthiopsis poae ATCC 64411]
MATTSIELPNGVHDHDDDDHVLRPRPRKPVHSQLSQLSTTSSNGTHLETPQDDGSTISSGRSTPVPADAPPSVKILSSARKQVRREHRELQLQTKDAQRRRLFPTTNFESRLSHLDPNSDYRDFHGFFNLFWIGLAIMAITTMLRNIKDTGYPMRVQIWGLFTVKVWELALADFLMVSTTAISLPLHRVFRAAPAGSLMTWARGGMAIMSVYQVLWLSLWIAVPFLLDWTWTAQVFFLLHTMVLLMKMHSYSFYNGHLCETEKRLRALDHPSTASKAPAYVYPSEIKVASPKRTTVPAPYRSIDDAVAVEDMEVKIKGTKVADASGPSPVLSGDADKREGGDWHGDGDDDDVLQLREDLARELTSPMGNTTYPRNLTWTNYLDFLVCPTLCYELEYPRTAKIDWQSLISKIVAVFGCIFLLTIVSEEFILPVLIESSHRLAATGSASETLLILAENISWLLFPFMMTFLLVFLVIFEYVLGACAEITLFADRHFYADWWNSTDWMEFSREWNIPVYAFLRRHVYSASRPHIGKPFATLITFLISAVGHEIVMGCITKKLRGYGFVCQMLQLPIFALQRTRWIRGKHTANNVFFWCSMILGLSLICSLYVLI